MPARIVPLVLACAICVTPAAAGVAAPEKAGDRVVCKTQRKTGTRLGSRICRTVDQWERITEENRRTAHELIDRPSIKIDGS